VVGFTVGKHKGDKNTQDRRGGVSTGPRSSYLCRLIYRLMPDSALFGRLHRHTSREIPFLASSTSPFSLHVLTPIPPAPRLLFSAPLTPSSPWGPGGRGPLWGNLSASVYGSFWEFSPSIVLEVFRISHFHLCTDPTVSIVVTIALRSRSVPTRRSKSQSHSGEHWTGLVSSPVTRLPSDPQLRNPNPNPNLARPRLVSTVS